MILMTKRCGKLIQASGEATEMLILPFIIIIMKILIFSFSYFKSSYFQYYTPIQLPFTKMLL